MATSSLETTRITFTTNGSTVACRATATADTLTFVGDAAASVTLTGVATPSSDGDVATKGYVDSVAQGLTWKDAVAVATTANGTLASDFENGDTVDGVVLSTGDRILIKNQTTANENGIYTVNASGAPTRATDMDTGSNAAGAAMFVEQGTANADTAWVCTNNTGSAVVGTDDLAFTQFSGGSGSPGGSDTQLQYNNSGSFGGLSTVTTDGTNLSISGGDLSLADSDNLNIGTGNDFSVTHDGTNTTATSATGDLIIDNTNATGATINRLGTDDSATHFRVHNNSDNLLFDVDGTGDVRVQIGSVSLASDNARLNIGAGLSSDLSFIHDGTNSIINSGTGNLVIDNTNATGSTVFRLGTDTSATDVLFQNNSESTIMSVRGDSSVNIPDFVGFTVGTGQDFSISHGADTTSMVAISGDILMGTVGVTNGITMALGTSTTATSFVVQDVSSSALLSVYGSGATVTSDTLTVQGGIAKTTTTTVEATAGNATYTAAELLGGLILRDPNGAARSDVTDTAANIVGEIQDAEVGTSFQFAISNTADAAETITLTAGTGVTLSGTMTIEQGDGRLFLLVMTNVTAASEAVTIYNLGNTAGGSTSPGGSDTQLQYNNSGAFGGVSSWTTNGTTTFNGADNAVLNMGSGNDLSITHDGTDTTITSTTGNLVVNNSNISGDTIFELGSFTSGTSFIVRDAVNLPRFTVAGDGQVDIIGNLDVSGGVDIDSDSAALTIGSGGDYSISHDGTDTIATSATGDFILDNTNATGSTINRLGTDTTATDFQVQNDSESALLTVDGAGTVTIPGLLDISGATALSGAPGTGGSHLDSGSQTYTDSSTAGSGTATAHVFHGFAQPTLAATNSSVTTTDAATVYIANAPAAGTNQTITNAHALWIDDGSTRLDGDVTMNSGTASSSTTTGALIVTGGVGISGDAYANSFNASSDVMLKTNIERLEDPLSKLKRLEGYRYNWKHEPEGKEQWGVIAQQLKDVGMEHLVSGEEGNMTVNYLGLIPLLIESVNKLSSELNHLKRFRNYRRAGQ